MISIDVISGFLGAGKTTFINKFCKSLQNYGETAVIIENEYGAESVDSDLLADTGYKIMDLSQGCICCNLKNGLEDALLQITAEIKPDRVIIEPSGIFILSSIFGILKSPEVMKQYEISSIITLIDAQLFLKCLNKYSIFIEDQIKYSSQIILTKQAGMPKEQIDIVVAEIKKIEPDTNICLDSIYELDDEKMMGFTQSYPAFQSDENIKLKHTPLKSVTLYPQKLYNLTELEDILKEITTGSFGELFRLKGFVKSSLNETKSFHLQYVSGDYTISPVTKQLKSMLNIIGDNINKSALTKVFS
ncbi:MAG: CobW family GTP-binding protein [Eubacteriales bacterium]